MSDPETKRKLIELIITTCVMDPTPFNNVKQHLVHILKKNLSKNQEVVLKKYYNEVHEKILYHIFKDTEIIEFYTTNNDLLEPQDNPIKAATAKFLIVSKYNECIDTEKFTDQQYCERLALDLCKHE